MDHSDKLNKVASRLSELEKISRDLYEVEERILAIEDELCDIDDALPKGPVSGASEREHVRHICSLLDRSYAIIDDLLGPLEESPERTCDISCKPLS